MSYAYVDYELAKREWAQRNPTATPAAYEAACARLAKRYGV